MYSLDESKNLINLLLREVLSDSSKRKYKICLKRHTAYFDMTLEKLIEKVDKEETIDRENKRKIHEF